MVANPKRRCSVNSGVRTLTRSRASVNLRFAKRKNEGAPSPRPLRVNAAGKRLTESDVRNL